MDKSSKLFIRDSANRSASAHVPEADGSPVVTNSLVWPDHGQEVGGVRDWSRHDVDDVSLLQHRDHLHGHLDMLHYPVKIRLKQLLTETCREPETGETA